MESFDTVLQRYRYEINNRMSSLLKKREPISMYEAGRYVLDAGGKRIRPLLTLLSCESVGGRWKDALSAAVAVEILHNFTLVHDDIMDAADSRRGRATVHKKWNDHVAILVGDALIAVAYHSLLETQSTRKEEIIRLFTDGLLEVCEGQTYDMEFEQTDNVTVEDYLLMIQKKTGALLNMSAAIGGVIGGANQKQLTILREFGTFLGLAFQIHDDLLDVQADEEKLGKPMYNDIKTGKRTYLLLYANEHAPEPRKPVLQRVLNRAIRSRKEIDEVLDLYEETKTIEASHGAIADFTLQAEKCLGALPSTPGREYLKAFAKMLLSRDY
jgi:geranylgeranyl diphosphate synthase, type II